MGFVRKVLGIVACQMALTFAFSLAASAFTPVGNFFRHPLTVILCITAFMTSICFLICNKHLTRKVPENYILLGIITVCEASLIATVAAELTETSVLTAIMATSVTTFCLYFAAVFTSTRARMVRNLVYGLIVAFIVDLCLLLFMVLTWNFTDKRLIFTISLLMVVISGIFIIFDLMMIIVPNAVDKEDYILAALNLYLDIARLFLNLLRILGEKK